ncbi:MAG: S8 family serine peptidase [Candidatus Riflebacteria bacterium]|nr:S8 family serine peptidase [Candidatus Riflebacteria bacterium]
MLEVARWLTIMAFVGSVVLPRAALGGGPTPIAKTTAGRALVPGKLVFMPRAGADRQALISYVKKVGGTIEKELPGLDFLVVKTAATTQLTMATNLAMRPDVAFAAPVYRYRIALAPNDTYYSRQYHHPLIGTPTAWDRTTGSTSITIAILDTGVDGTHPDLASKMLQGYNFYDNNSNTSDVQGHGTAVAGTAAAIGNNGLGVAGVAWQNRILPVRIASPDGQADSDTIAQAMRYAADQGARVVNCSFGPCQGDAIVSAAARYVRSRGGLVFVAAGTDGTRNAGASDPAIIFVSATNASDAKTSWSTYGPAVRLAAPGEQIATTMRGSQYGLVDGTSFSSPMAAGVAALVWSAAPTLTNAQIENVLQTTARDLGAAGRDESFGHGRVDAAVAMAAVGGTTPPPPGSDTTPPQATITRPASGSTVSGQVTVSVVASDAVGVASVALLVDGSAIGTDTTAPYTFSWNAAGAASGPHTLVAQARDAAGNVGRSSTVTVQIQSQGSGSIVITSPTSGSAWTSPYLGVAWVSPDRTGIWMVNVTIDGLWAGTFYARSPITSGWFWLPMPCWLGRGSHSMVLTGVTSTGGRVRSAPITIRR